MHSLSTLEHKGKKLLQMFLKMEKTHQQQQFQWWHHYNMQNEKIIMNEGNEWKQWNWTHKNEKTCAT